MVGQINRYAEKVHLFSLFIIDCSQTKIHSRIRQSETMEKGEEKQKRGISNKTELLFLGGGGGGVY